MVTHTWMPIDFRCMVFCSSRTRPDAASSALDGTQPLFTQVPPMSCPSITAVLSPCAGPTICCHRMITAILKHGTIGSMQR